MKAETLNELKTLDKALTDLTSFLESIAPDKRTFTSHWEGHSLPIKILTAFWDIISYHVIGMAGVSTLRRSKRFQEIDAQIQMIGNNYLDGVEDHAKQYSSKSYQIIQFMLIVFHGYRELIGTMIAQKRIDTPEYKLLKQLIKNKTDLQSKYCAFLYWTEIKDDPLNNSELEPNQWLELPKELWRDITNRTLDFPGQNGHLDPQVANTAFNIKRVCRTFNTLFQLRPPTKASIGTYDLKDYRECKSALLALPNNTVLNLTLGDGVFSIDAWEIKEKGAGLIQCRNYTLENTSFWPSSGVSAVALSDQRFACSIQDAIYLIDLNNGKPTLDCMHSGAGRIKDLAFMTEKNLLFSIDTQSNLTAYYLKDHSLVDTTQIDIRHNWIEYTLGTQGSLLACNNSNQDFTTWDFSTWTGPDSRNGSFFNQHQTDDISIYDGPALPPWPGMCIKMTWGTWDGVDASFDGVTGHTHSDSNLMPINEHFSLILSDQPPAKAVLWDRKKQSEIETLTSDDASTPQGQRPSGQAAIINGGRFVLKFGGQIILWQPGSQIDFGQELPSPISNNKAI